MFGWTGDLQLERVRQEWKCIWVVSPGSAVRRDIQHLLVRSQNQRLSMCKSICFRPRAQQDVRGRKLPRVTIYCLGLREKRSHLSRLGSQDLWICSTSCSWKP